MNLQSSIESKVEPSSRIKLSHLAIGVFLLVVGGVLGAGAMSFPADKGYSILGPHVFPLIVSGYLLLIGAMLTWESITGGFHNLEEADLRNDDEVKHAKTGATWVSAGILVEALLISHIGFVLASSMLFMLAARGFGSRRPVLDVAVGLALTLPVFWLFTAGLGLSLPAIFAPWI